RHRGPDVREFRGQAQAERNGANEEARLPNGAVQSNRQRESDHAQADSDRIAEQSQIENHCNLPAVGSRIGTDLTQGTRCTGLAVPQPLKQRLTVIEKREIVGHQAKLEIAPILALETKPGPGEIGRAEIEPLSINDHRLQMDARAVFHLQTAAYEARAAI